MPFKLFNPGCPCCQTPSGVQPQETCICFYSTFFGTSGIMSSPLYLNFTTPSGFWVQGSFSIPLTNSKSQPCYYSGVWEITGTNLLTQDLLIQSCTPSDPFFCTEPSPVSQCTNNGVVAKTTIGITFSAGGGGGGSGYCSDGLAGWYSIFEFDNDTVTDGFTIERPDPEPSCHLPLDGCTNNVFTRWQQAVNGESGWCVTSCEPLLAEGTLFAEAWGSGLNYGVGCLPCAALDCTLWTSPVDPPYGNGTYHLINFTITE